MPRRLRPDEEALWRRVAANATPLHTDRRAPTAPVAREAPAAATPAQQIRPFRVGESASQPPPLVPSVERALPGIDRRTHRDLSRGKRAPEGTIDLHGMTLSEAHPALTRFILASFATGRRLVLVITGKGRGGETNWHTHKGVLRRQVPDWLSRPPLGNVVQEVLPAHRSHGGSGAYYIVLRRN